MERKVVMDSAFGVDETVPRYTERSGAHASDSTVLDIRSLACTLPSGFPVLDFAFPFFFPSAIDFPATTKDDKTRSHTHHDNQLRQRAMEKFTMASGRQWLPLHRFPSLLFFRWAFLPRTYSTPCCVVLLRGISHGLRLDHRSGMDS